MKQNAGAGSSSSPAVRPPRKPVARPRRSCAPRPPDAPSGQILRHTFGWPGHYGPDAWAGPDGACDYALSAVASSCFRRLVFALELQADWKRMAQAAHHLFGPLQVEKTARHVGVGIGLMDVALIGFQDRDFGLSPVAVLLRLRRMPIESAVGPRRPTPSPPTGQGRFGLATTSLAMRGSRLCDCDGCVALVDPLLADLSDIRSTGLGSTFRSDSSARSRDAC